MRRPAVLVLLAAACGDPATAPAPTARVEAVGGTDQVGAAAFRLADSLVVRVVDADGAPVPGAIVTWDTEDREGVVSPASTTTDPSGFARASWVLGRDDGTQSVTATHRDIPAVRFFAEARSGEVLQAGGPLGHQCGRFADDVVRCWATPTDGPAQAVALDTDLRFLSLGYAHDRWCGSARGGAIACILESELTPGGLFRPEAAPVRVVAQGAPELLRVVGAGDPEVGLTWCGQAINQSVWCWGNNEDGQLGNGVIGGASDTPVPVSGNRRVISVAVTAGAACALDEQGIPWCWGSAAQGVVPGGVASATPVQVPTARRFFQIAADGHGSVCAVDAEALVYCWGSNVGGGRGRTGLGPSSEPVAIEGTDFYVALIAGSDGFLGLTVDRTLVTWGGLTAVGINATPVRVLPQQVFAELLPGGGAGALCLRAYPTGTRCVDRVALVRALAASTDEVLIYGVPGS